MNIIFVFLSVVSVLFLPSMLSYFFSLRLLFFIVSVVTFLFSKGCAVQCQEQTPA